MTESYIYKGSNMVPLTVQTYTDLSGYSSVKIAMVKPDGTSSLLDATVSGAVTSGVLVSSLLSTDLDQGGYFIFQSFVTFADGRSFYGKAVRYRIYDIGEVPE